MNDFSERKYVLGAIFILTGVIFVSRLFYMQVVTDQYKIKALKNSTKSRIDYPERGIIYDRNSEVLAHNKNAFDLLAIPREMKNFDTVAFCDLMGITKYEFLEKTKPYRRSRQFVIEEMITAEDFVLIQEKLHEFPGLEFQKRSVRDYPVKAGAHVLGYLAKVNQSELDHDEYYGALDYIGKTGLERFYEDDLRGEKGIKYLTRDARNNVRGKFLEGELDTMAVAGKDLYTTLDAELQKYGEYLMKNKRGAIVALEPSTGEVLCMVSSPTYDPNSLVGGSFSSNYTRIRQQPYNVFLNRATFTDHPPGSIVKPFQAMVALQERKATQWTRYACDKGLVGCHWHKSPLNMKESIQHSCNPYYYRLVQSVMMPGKLSKPNEDARDGFNNWRTYFASLGLGQKLGIDIREETSGRLPKAEYYDRVYGKYHWNFRTIYSLSIGQGEMELTPLQMANLAAILANGGFYFTPHLVKFIEGYPGNWKEDRVKKVETKMDETLMDIVRDGMQWVLEKPGGTAGIARLQGVTICGKTGTSQNPHGEDHSVFSAFAPRENPRIAIAVFIENAGGGGSWAAPIASLMIEKYLKREISRPELEDAMRNANLLEVEVEDEEGNG